MTAHPSMPHRTFPGFLVVLLVVGIPFLILAAPADAQVERATVSVEGMSCPFCAFGVEKRLRKVDGTASVEVSMKDGTATLQAAEDASIDVTAIPDAVRKAGFSPGPVELVARGTLRVETPEDGHDRHVLDVGGEGSHLLLVNLSDEERRTLEELAEAGAEVRVEGEAHYHETVPPGLEPSRITKVTEAAQEK